MGRKAAQTTRNINKPYGPGSANKRTAYSSDTNRIMLFIRKLSNDLGSAADEKRRHAKLSHSSRRDRHADSARYHH